MSFPTLEAFLAGAPIKTQVPTTGGDRDVYFKYAKCEYGVGHFEIRDIATNKLTVESIVDKIPAPSLERGYVRLIYDDIKFWYDLEKGADF